jgi:lipid-binding SYLF domain-containing protein
VDGVMGPMTRCALQVYQRSNDLQATGRIDDQTRAALGIGEMRHRPDAEPGVADTETFPGRADDPDTDWETQPETEPETDMDTQPETRPDWETQPETQPDTDMDTQPETRPDWETQPETRPDTDMDTQPETQRDRDAEPGTDYDAQQPGTLPGETGRPDTDFGDEHGQQPGTPQDQPGVTPEEQDRDRERQEAEHRAEDRDETELARQAAEVLQEMTQEEPDHDIPRWLMERARAIAVIPNVTQAALVVGGRWGDGLITSRGAVGEWSAPAFITIGGASVGLQVGVERSDVILVFTDEQSVQRIAADNGRFELGVDAQVTAGPVGREAAVATDAELAPVYSYSRARGLFAGASLEGAVINLDEEANQRVYGTNVTGRNLLIDRTVQTTAAVQPFLNAVQQHVQPMVAE